MLTISSPGRRDDSVAAARDTREEAARETQTTST